MEDAKLRIATEEARRLRFGDMYQHLPNSELDWSLEGRLVDRVVGAHCYGSVSLNIGHFATHLGRNYHIVSDISLS